MNSENKADVGNWILTLTNSQSPNPITIRSEDEVDVIDHDVGMVPEKLLIKYKKKYCISKSNEFLRRANVVISCLERAKELGATDDMNMIKKRYIKLSRRYKAYKSMSEKYTECEESKWK